MSKPLFPVDESVSEMVSLFRAAEFQLAKAMQDIYVGLIEREFADASSKIVIRKSIKSAADISENVPAARGLYVILSSYNAGPNKCVLKFGRLRAVYRGHAYNMRERVQSHLDNKNYRTGKKKKEQGYWKECMKLGSLFRQREGGIDIDSPELAGISWEVISLQLPDSTAFMREQAEWAFDLVFKKPIGNEGERKKPPYLPAEYKDISSCTICGHEPDADN